MLLASGTYLEAPSAAGMRINIRPDDSSLVVVGKSASLLLTGLPSGTLLVSLNMMIVASGVIHSLVAFLVFILPRVAFLIIVSLFAFLV